MRTIRSGGRYASPSLAVRTGLGWCSFLRSWLATIRSTLANHDHVCDVLINAGVSKKSLRNFCETNRIFNESRWYNNFLAACVRAGNTSASTPELMCSSSTTRSSLFRLWRKSAARCGPLLDTKCGMNTRAFCAARSRRFLNNDEMVGRDVLQCPQRRFA